MNLSDRKKEVAAEKSHVKEESYLFQVFKVVGKLSIKIRRC